MAEQPNEDQHDAEVIPLRPDTPPSTDTEAPDSGAETVTGSKRDGERRDIVPKAFQRANIRQTIRFHRGLLWHRVRFHGLRLPAYIPLTAFWACAGALKLGMVQLAWAMDSPTQFLAMEAVGQGDAPRYLQLSKHAREARKVRLAVLAAEGVALVAGLVLVATVAPLYAGVLLAAVTVPVLARLGRPDDHPIVKQAVVPPVYEAPTPAIIERALGSIGIAQINAALKDGGHISWVTDVFRDGPGWACEFDAPWGCTAEMILAKRDQLASGLRRPLSAVWPEPRPIEHPGRCNLWIGFSDASKVPAAAYPLLKTGTADIFGQVPFGTDPRQRPVTSGLFELNYLIGAAPGQGKTATVRVLAAAAALDVVADIWCHEFSGKGDLEALSRISHRYVGGLDDESIAYGADSLTKLRAELERRSTVFKKVPKEQRRDGKITRELAAKKSSRLRPIVAIFDECQNLFMHPKYGKQAAEDAAYIIRLGRAYRLIIILSTQRPDKDSLPTSISGIVQARFCLSVPDQVSNDMILGTSSYSQGYNSALFRPKTDAGWGWLKSESAPLTVRTYYVDLDKFERIVQRARIIREQAGVLSGYALGEDDDSPARDVLSDVQSVFGPDAGLQWAELAARLAERYPHWSGVTADAVSAQVRDLGVTAAQVKSGGTNRQGVKRADVDRLVTQ